MKREKDRLYLTKKDTVTSAGLMKKLAVDPTNSGNTL